MLTHKSKNIQKNLVELFGQQIMSKCKHPLSSPLLFPRDTVSLPKELLWILVRCWLHFPSSFKAQWE